MVNATMGNGSTCTISPYLLQVTFDVFSDKCSSNDICLDTVSRNVIEPRCEKTGLRGFRPGPTQTRLYNHTRWLEA